MDNKQESKMISGKTKKSIALLTSLILALCVAVGGVIAFLVDRTDDVQNTFLPSEVTTTVEETLDNGVKTDVKIKNTGDTTAWIRAAVLVTWQNADGDVYGQLPVQGTDYTISYNLNEQENGKWIAGDDGYYYWSRPVKSDDEDSENCMTGILISSCSKSDSAKVPDGYNLTVEIISSGVQAYGEALGSVTGGQPGDDPVEIAWSSDKVKITVTEDETGMILAVDEVTVTPED